MSTASEAAGPSADRSGPQALTLEQLHDDENRSVTLLDVIDPDDILMIQARDGPGFVVETLRKSSFMARLCLIILIATGMFRPLWTPLYTMLYPPLPIMSVATYLPMTLSAMGRLESNRSAMISVTKSRNSGSLLEIRLQIAPFSGPKAPCRSRLRRGHAVAPR